MPLLNTYMSYLPAAAETIVASNATFFFAMLKLPEVQRRAQEEIDSVVGRDRLPEFSDVERLPYLCAVMKEALRWVGKDKFGQSVMYVSYDHNLISGGMLLHQ